MWFLRLAKLRHKIFWTQFLFGTRIKTTYKIVLPNIRILDLCAKRRSKWPISVLGLRQKIDQIAPPPPHLFSTLYQNSSLSCTLQYIKIWKHLFLLWQDMAHFDLLHGQKWKISTFPIKQKNICLFKTNYWRFIMKVKILHFWPCQKTKWVISCQNGKRCVQIFYIL